jgi:hypothetical protein
MSGEPDQILSASSLSHSVFVVGSSSKISSVVLFARPHGFRAGKHRFDRGHRDLLVQPILVENRAGANNAASDFVAKERPDGYTVLVASDSIAINASLFKNLSFNPVTSFAPVTQAITSPQVLAVRPNFGVKTVAEHLAKLKANPGGVNVGLTGRGTIDHLTSELINLNQGSLKVSYVPNTGGAPAVRDLVGGHIDALYVTLPAVTGSWRGGSIIPVAVSSPKRSKAFPDVPTFAETAAPELSLDSWQGFLFPPARHSQSSTGSIGNSSRRCRARRSLSRSPTSASRLSPALPARSRTSSMPTCSGLARSFARRISTSNRRRGATTPRVA